MQKYYKKDFNKDLIKIFGSICKFCNKVVNKFILLIRKGIYSYEYMDSCKKFDESFLPDKEDFYSSLNMDEITQVLIIGMQKEYLKTIVIKV